MASSPMPELELLQQLFTYDPESGDLTWKARPPSLFQSEARMSADAAAARWNGMYAGRAVGSVFIAGGSSYRRTTISNRYYFVHRIIWVMMTGQQPPPIIDHIDGNGLNNSWKNLRAATRKENRLNSRANRRTSSRFKGVSFKTQAGKWYATIEIGGTSKHLGCFSCEREAAMAYDLAAAHHFGRFARLNFPADAEEGSVTT